MKKITLSIVTILLFTIFSSAFANAQYVEDALRFAKPNSYITPRAAALGFSYFGFSDDAGALISNPAGVTLVPQSEIGIGLDLTARHNVETNFLSNARTDKKNDFFLSNVQFVTSSLSLNDDFRASYGFSYNVDNDFDCNSRFSGYNTENSFIGQQASKHQVWTQIVNVADSNYHTGAARNLQQDGYIKEYGGLHNISFGGGIDFQQFAFGATLNLRFGTYDYSRKYFETDVNNVHNTYFTDDLYQLQVKDVLSQTLFGVSGIIGFQYRHNDLLRIGLAIQLPTSLYIDEDFSSDFIAQFDPEEKHPEGQSFRYTTGNQTQAYNIVLPYEFKLGFSGNYMGLSYSVCGAISDPSSSYFTSENGENMEDILWFDDLNDATSQQLCMQYTLGLGLEYKIPQVPVYVRCGWTLVTSPYKESDLGSAVNSIGAGFGLAISKNFICDMSFNYSTYDAQRANYGSVDLPQYFSKYTANISASTYAIGLRYRFD